MRIFVTGAAGFIGHKLVLKLQSLGHDVYGCDNFTNYARKSPTNEEMAKLHHERIFNFRHLPLNIDINNVAALTSAMIDVYPDAVINCAAYSNAALVKANPAAGIASLTTGLLNVVMAAEVGLRGIGPFIHLSSSMVYGRFTKDPQDENGPCMPTTLYGVNKLAGEMLIREKMEDFFWTIIRPSAVYGPGDAGNRVIEKFIRAAAKGENLIVNGPNERADFTHVDDLVLGIIQCMDQPGAFKGTFNLTRGRSRTILEAATIVRDVVGSGQIQIDRPDALISGRGTLDIKFAQETFGYAPCINLEEGIKDYWQWMKDRRMV